MAKPAKGSIVEQGLQEIGTSPPPGVSIPDGNLLNEVAAEAAANDAKSGAGGAPRGVVNESEDEPEPPLPGAEASGDQGPGIKANPFEPGPTLDGVDSKGQIWEGGVIVGMRGASGGPGPIGEPRPPLKRELSAEEIASWKAFGERNGLFAAGSGPVAAQPGARPSVAPPSLLPAGVQAEPNAKPFQPGARPWVHLPEEKDGAPPCPAKDPSQGDKTRDYFVWQCRYGNFADVVSRYLGRIVAGELITEEVIQRVRDSRAK
jgi:hypothetical protein